MDAQLSAELASKLALHRRKIHCIEIVTTAPENNSEQNTPTEPKSKRNSPRTASPAPSMATPSLIPAQKLQSRFNGQIGMGSISPKSSSPRGGRATPQRKDSSYNFRAPQGLTPSGAVDSELATVTNRLLALADSSAQQAADLGSLKEAFSQLHAAYHASKSSGKVSISDGCIELM